MPTQPPKDASSWTHFSSLKDKRIVEKGADYVICLRGNQAALHEAAKAAFVDVEKAALQSGPFTSAETFEEGHGRVETRRCWVTSHLETFARHAEWTGLRSFAVVESERTVREKHETQVERGGWSGDTSSAVCRRMMPSACCPWSVRATLSRTWP